MTGINWIVSFPKSGNTWFRAFIANVLRQMQAPGADPVPINEIGRYAAGHSGWPLYQPYLDKPFRDAKVSEISAIRAQVQRDLAAKLATPVFLKNHFPRSIDVFGNPMIAEDAMNGAIYIARDPRDVVLSYRSHMGLETVDQAIQVIRRGTVAGLAHNPWRAHELYGSWSAHVRSWLKLDRPDVVFLRYEDMIAQPYHALGAAAQRIGVMADNDAIARAVDATRFDRLKAEENEKGFRENVKVAKDQFFRSGRAGGWRDELTPEQVRKIEDAFGETMQRLGYPLAERRNTGDRDGWQDPRPGVPPYAPDRAKHAWWRIRAANGLYRWHKLVCAPSRKVPPRPGPILPTPQVHLAGAFSDDPSPALPDPEKAQEIADRFDAFVARRQAELENQESESNSASTTPSPVKEQEIA